MLEQVLTFVFIFSSQICQLKHISDIFFYSNYLLILLFIYSLKDLITWICPKVVYCACV